MQPLIRSALGTPVAGVLAVLAGLLIGTGFAPMDFWVGPMVGVPLLTWIVAGRGLAASGGLGLVAGLALNTLTLHWIAVLGAPVAAALVVFMSLWTAVTAMALSRVTRLPAWPVWAACVWVAVELVSGRVPFGGFPWNRLGYTAVDQPLSGWFAWVGVTGAGFLLVLASHLVLVALLERPWRLRAATAAVAIFVAGGLLGLAPVGEPEQQVRVGVVQGNVNRAEHGSSTYARSVTTNHLSETVFLLASQRAAGQPAMDFIVWPENATDIDPVSDPGTRATVTNAVQLARVPIFVGAVMEGPVPDSRQTSSLWWHPESGPGARYDKRNLVPFGEWIPFREFLLPRLPILEQIGRQSIPGTTAGVVDAPTAQFNHLRVGTVICFELAWDDTVYDTIRHGAHVIVTQSNTNTYASTFEPHQQMAINRVRAMEVGREMVASTVNGLSGLIDARGRVSGGTDELTAAHRVYDLPLRYNVNLAVRLSPWLGYVLAAAGVAAVAASYRRRDVEQDSATLEHEFETELV